jgi:hypothetical protein
MIDAFKKANKHALHAKRKTIAVEDMQMAVWFAFLKLLLSCRSKTLAWQ